MNREELLNLAQHIQIKLTDEEVQQLLPQINNVLDYTQIINNYDCDQEEELFFMTKDTNRFREDEPIPSISLSDALKNAPLKNENFFKVPKVME